MKKKLILLVAIAGGISINSTLFGAAVNTDDFHNAAKKGKTKKTLCLLKAGADVNAWDKTGRTALMRAAQFGDATTMQDLIDAGAHVDAQNFLGYTALTEATQRRGDAAKVTVLINAGADVNVQDMSGKTPLMHAAVNGLTAAAQALIEAGANVNAQDMSGKTPLMHAAVNGLTATAQALIEAGANVDAQNKYGSTALIIAIDEHNKTYDETYGWQGRHPIYGGGPICDENEVIKRRNAYIDIIRTLIANHADVNIRNKKGRTALMLVGKNEHATMIRALLGAGTVTAAAPPAHDTLAGSAERPHTPPPSYTEAIRGHKKAKIRRS